jgi:hypothetical protein
VHGAELQDAEEYDVKLRRVRQEDPHAIAFAYAFCSQQRGKAIALFIEVGISRDMPVKDHCRFVRLQLCPDAQIFAERRLAVRIVRLPRRAGRPRFLPKRVKPFEIVVFLSH